VSAGLTPEEMRELVRKQIEELWGRSNPDLIPEMYAEDVVDHNPLPGQTPGHEGLREAIRVFSTAFPDIEMTLHGVLADGDYAADFWTFRATHLGPFAGLPPTGRRVEFNGIDVVKVRDGRIAEIWHVEDMARMLDQLGVTDRLPRAGDAGPAAGAATEVPA
jgi:steroid delta-isomerase-like uncharacterized protein